MKRFILALSTFFLLLPTFVAAAPDPVRTLARVFGREYRNFAGVRAPLYAYVLVTIIIWTILYLAVNLLPLIKNSEGTSAGRIAMVLSLAIALFTILSSSFVEWFYIFFGGFLWFVGIIALVGIVYLFWHSLSWIHTKSTEAWYGDMEKVAKAGEKKANAIKQKVDNFKNIKEAKKERQKLAKKYARDKAFGGEIGGAEKEENKKKQGKYFKALKTRVNNIHIPTRSRASILKTVKVLEDLLAALPDKDNLKGINSDEGKEYLQAIENHFGKLGQDTPAASERYEEEDDLFEILDNLRSTEHWNNLSRETRQQLESDERSLLDQASKIRGHLKQLMAAIYPRIQAMIQTRTGDENEEQHIIASFNQLRDYLDKQRLVIGNALGNYEQNVITFSNKLNRFAQSQEDQQELNTYINTATEKLENITHVFRTKSPDEWFSDFMTSKTTLSNYIQRVISAVEEYARNVGSQHVHHTNEEREFLNAAQETLEMIEVLHGKAGEYVAQQEEFTKAQATAYGLSDLNKTKQLENILIKTQTTLAEAIVRDLNELQTIIQYAVRAIQEVGRNTNKAIRDLQAANQRAEKMPMNYAAMKNHVIDFINDFVDRAEKEAQRRKDEVEDREHKRDERREAARRADLNHMMTMLAVLGKQNPGFKDQISDLLKDIFGGNGNNQNTP